MRGAGYCRPRGSWRKRTGSGWRTSSRRPQRKASLDGLRDLTDADVRSFRPLCHGWSDGGNL